MAESRWETEGRAHYAQTLARWLIREGYRPAVVSTWTGAQWLEAARMAGIRSAIERGKVPSDRTRGIVIGLITPSPVHGDYYAGERSLREDDGDGGE